jgi:hypothetical protein
MTPFPFPYQEVFDFVWGEERLAHIVALPRDLFSYDRRFRFDYKLSAGEARKVTLTFDEPVIVLRNFQVLSGDHLPDSMKTSIEDWVVRRRMATHDYGVVNEAVKKLLETARTYRQLKGFWPTFSKFLEPGARYEFDSVAPTKPSTLLLNTWAQSTVLTPDEVDTMLSEAMLLEDLPMDESATYD